MDMSQIKLDCNDQNLSHNAGLMKLIKPHFRRVLIPIVVGINLLSACALRSDSSYSTKMSELDAPAAEALIEKTPNATNSPPAEVVENLKTALATEMGVPITEISVKETTQTEWNDACLGAANPDEICAQVITPGYRIVLGTLTETYTFHTDQTGENFRRVESSPTEKDASQSQESQ